MRTMDRRCSSSRSSAETAGCVIADLRMPGMDGLDLQQALMRGSNALPVIFLTGDGDIPTPVRAMRRERGLPEKRAPKENLLAPWTRHRA